MLQAIGRQTQHAGRTTITITSPHGEHRRARRAFLRIAGFFARLSQTAEQLTDLDRSYRILSYAPQRAVRGNAPSVAASSWPPAPVIPRVHLTLFGSGFAGLGLYNFGMQDGELTSRLPY